MPQAYWIIPLEGGGGQVDNTLPGGLPNYPSGGPVRPGGPVDPGYGRPGVGWPDHIWGQRPPHIGGGPAWSPGHPGGGPMPGGGQIDNELPLPQGGTEVPEDVYQPAPIPEEIASQYVVSVYDPKTMVWTTKSYAPR